MTISRNKREGWYQAQYQGEFYRTFKKRNSLRYNYKLGSPAWVQDLSAESKIGVSGFIGDLDINSMYRYPISFPYKNTEVVV